MIVDLVSDLHDDKFTSKLEWWNNSDRASILIVAGDVTDSKKDTCDYLKKLCNFYDTILFVDGNHDHAERYPGFYASSEWEDDLPPKVIHLPSHEDFIIDGVGFVGCCGWWNYEGDIHGENATIIDQYFSIHFPKLSLDTSTAREFAFNVIQRGDSEVSELRRKIAKMHDNEDVHTIVVVTHTPPIPDNRDTELATYMHTDMEVVKQQSDKIKLWLFGHIHEKVDKVKYEIRFVAHPRGTEIAYSARRLFF